MTASNSDANQKTRHFDGSDRPHCVLGVDPGLNRTGYAILERSAEKPVLREGGVIPSTKTF
ncbi:MAG: crossover junction endodeoxyribonuclease RuvC, partial [Schlesneria sp.]